jgi:hypothetical protein
MKVFKWFKSLSSALLFLGLFLGGLGCESTHNTRSLLSAAGFRSVRPTTPQERACFDSLEPNTVQRTEKNGQVVYAFADKRSGLLYIGGEREYQRFHELGLQQRIANQELMAAQMNQNAAMNWAWGWGPPGTMWW